jgi:phosphoribosyl-dephospho-CoA transferase
MSNILNKQREKVKIKERKLHAGKLINVTVYCRGPMKKNKRSMTRSTHEKK